MFEGKTILAVIAARGGSKGIPGKNIRMAGGKPLVAWIIETAKKSTYIDRLILSCDDQNIITIAEQYGCEAPFVRPKEIARDESSVNDVILHAMERMPGYDYVMLLQPTSPLTCKEDIDGCIFSAVTSRYQSMISVTQPVKSPYWMFAMNESQLLEPILGREYLNCRRQDLPLTYIPSGAFYIAESGWFVENKSFYSEVTAGYAIPNERSLDIDTEIDFKLLEEHLSNG